MWPVTLKKRHAQDIISQENVFNESFVAACTSDYMKIHLSWLQVWQHIHTYKQVVHLYCMYRYVQQKHVTLWFKVVQVCYIY